MDRKWFLTGLGAFLVLVLIVFPLLIKIPVQFTFTGDAQTYSRAAINFSKTGFLTYDGIHPLINREPGMSIFLALIYVFFGAENAVPFFIIQSLLLLISSFLFCEALGRETTPRVAGISFLLILVSGSVMHSLFSAYREGLALILLLFFLAAYLSDRERPNYWKKILMGAFFTGLILTYYSFVFFIPVLPVLSYLEGRRVMPMLITVLVCVIGLTAYAARNFAYDGRLRIMGSERADVMWYVRGEQAADIRGLEPFWCLWAEYVSRDWSGRSPDCSFNAVWHRRWPQNYEGQTDVSAEGRNGITNIKQNFGWYLWFSVFEILELHIPYVGGGFSHTFNLYAILTGLLTYFGMLLGLKKLFNWRFLIFTALIGYHTGVFVLTDATPRYLVPVLMGYTVFSAIGYDALLKRLNL